MALPILNSLNILHTRINCFCKLLICPVTVSLLYSYISFFLYPCYLFTKTIISATTNQLVIWFDSNNSFLVAYFVSYNSATHVRANAITRYVKFIWTIKRTYTRLVVINNNNIVTLFISFNQIIRVDDV